jgi:hypothetical protein
MSPPVVAGADGGGESGGTTVVEITPANAGVVKATINTDAAQNLRKLFILFS